MNAIKLIRALCAVSLLVGPVLADIAEAKMRPHRRHVSDRYHRHEDRRERDSPRIEEFQRNRQDRRGNEWDTSCFTLPYLLRQYACNTGGGDS
jgi:hypothetical protein